MGGGAGAYRAAPSEQPSLEFFRSSENRLTLGKGVSKPMYRTLPLVVMVLGILVFSCLAASPTPEQQSRIAQLEGELALKQAH